MLLQSRLHLHIGGQKAHFYLLKVNKSISSASLQQHLFGNCGATPPSLFPASLPVSHACSAHFLLLYCKLAASPRLYLDGCPPPSPRVAVQRLSAESGGGWGRMHRKLGGWGRGKQREPGCFYCLPTPASQPASQPGNSSSQLTGKCYLEYA